MLRTALIGALASTCWASSGLVAKDESSTSKFTSMLQERRFGVQVHCDGMTPCDNPPLQQICEAAQIMRTGAWWRYVEKVKGQYDFGLHDDWLQKVAAVTGSCSTGTSQPMQSTFVLNGGNHLYGGEDSTSPTTPEQVTGYVNFVVAILTHFKGRGILWELYNEPDLSVRKITVEQYAHLVISVGQAVRGNPEIASELLMGPSVSEISCDYMTSFKNAGGLQYVDAVSVHAYVAGAPEQTRWQFAKIKDIVGSSAQLVSGEWGWATCTNLDGSPAECEGGTMPDIVTVTDQAMYVARQWLIHALDGVPLSIYYEWMNDDSDPHQCESNWGLVKSDGTTAKPAYNAAKMVQKFIGLRPFLQQVATRGNTAMEYALAFGPAGNAPPPLTAVGVDNGDAEVIAVWTLAMDGSTSKMTGSKDSAYCAGNALWTGMASDCEQKCASTAGCRGYVSYSTGTVHDNSNCQLTGSRCTVPRDVGGCGINIWHQQCPGGPSESDGAVPTNQTNFPSNDPACDSAKAYTLLQSSTPPPVVFANPGRFNCYSVFDMLGQSGGADVCASGGTLTVRATEKPVYLVGKS